MTMGTDSTESDDDSAASVVDAAVDTYLRARSWVVTAQFVESDALYAVCHEVVEGRLSAREAARRIGTSKSTLSRMVEQVKAGNWESSLSQHLSVEAFTEISSHVHPHPEPVPFERVTDDEGVPRLRWTNP